MKKGFLSLVVLLAGMISVYPFRYKIFNGMSNISFLRKGMIQLSMNIPFVRKKILGQLFHKA